MHTSVAFSGWDTAVLMAPLFGLLAFWMFHLDERFAAPRARAGRRHFCEPDGPGGDLGCSDPDGTPWPIRGRLVLECLNTGRTVEILPPLRSHDRAGRVSASTYA